MKTIFVICTVCAFCIQPVSAQEDDGASLMERGARQFLEGLLNEMEPALEGMGAFLDQMGPALADIMAEVKDWSVYETPEILDNGDIIIRRKPDNVPQTDPLNDPAPQIDL